MFSIFCLIMLVLARNWVLGFAMCSMNYLAMIIYHSTFISIYIIISRDKLKGVKDPLYGRPTNKRAYLNSIVVWVIDVVILTGFFVWNWEFITNEGAIDEYGSFICFGFTSM